MSQAEQANAGQKADELIATEVAIQDRMWGEANERADSTNSQLLAAGLAQLTLVQSKVWGFSAEDALERGLQFYPAEWSGFRDYGSNVANLVVAAAFIRSEIKRRILLNEDTTRAKRQSDQAYTPETGLPYVSSEEALAK